MHSHTLREASYGISEVRLPIKIEAGPHKSVYGIITIKHNIQKWAHIVLSKRYKWHIVIYMNSYHSYSSKNIQVMTPSSSYSHNNLLLIQIYIKVFPNWGKWNSCCFLLFYFHFFPSQRLLFLKTEAMIWSIENSLFDPAKEYT